MQKTGQPPPLAELEYGQYLQTFQDAALAHGLDFEDRLRKIQFIDVDGPAEAADCANDNAVVIPSLYRISYGETYLEQFIYHQLAHCTGLRPSHDDAKLPNGEWKSVMRNFPMFGHFGQAIDFNGPKREYYLAELFDPTTGHAAYFDADPIPFDGTLPRELAASFACHTLANPSNYDTSTGFDIEIIANGPSPAPAWNITIWGDDQLFNLTYSPSLRSMFLRSPHDFEFILSHDFESDQQLPTGNAILTIRRLSNRLAFYLNDQYLFHRDYPAITWNLMSVVSVGPCDAINFYRLN